MMQDFAESFRQRPALRIAVLMVVAVGLAALLVPQPVWSSLALKATRAFGITFILLVISAAVWWVTYSRRVFKWLVLGIVLPAFLIQSAVMLTRADDPPATGHQPLVKWN